MPKRIKKYQGSPLAMFGPLYNAEGEAGGGGASTATVEPKAEEDANPAATDEPLGENGKKALDREREARKALEGQVTQMREAFAQALGVKPDNKADTADLLGQFQARLDEMQLDARVERVARQNGITDDGDLDLLRSAKDEEQMTKLATRLKAVAEQQSAPGTPRPDRTQGPQGSTNEPERKPGIDRLSAGVTAALDKS